jgi:hypothetical protein
MHQLFDIEALKALPDDVTALKAIAGLPSYFSASEDVSAIQVVAELTR